MAKYEPRDTLLRVYINIFVSSFTPDVCSNSIWQCYPLLSTSIAFILKNNTGEKEKHHSLLNVRKQWVAVMFVCTYKAIDKQWSSARIEHRTDLTLSNAYISLVLFVEELLCGNQAMQQISVFVLALNIRWDRLPHCLWCIHFPVSLVEEIPRGDDSGVQAVPFHLLAGLWSSQQH